MQWRDGSAAFYSPHHFLRTAEMNVATAAMSAAAAVIALAAVTIHAMTPRHAHWGGGDYPPIGARLEAMIGGHNLPEESIFWPFTACLLISLLRQNGRRLDYQGGSYRSLAITLLHELQ